MSTEMMRSLLFVPAEERKLSKLPGLDSDGIIIDLEDAVPPARKSDARKLAAEWLPRVPGPLTVVRVNTEPEELTEDLRAVVGPNVDAVMLPKLESTDSLRDLDRRLAELEAEQSLEPGRIRILGLIETARGVVALEEIAMTAPPRLLTFCLGPADLATDLRLHPRADGDELAYVRSRVVVATRAAGLPSPIDGPFGGIRDLVGLAGDSCRSRAFGFQGRLVLHPDHVPTVRHSYAGTSLKEIKFARKVVALFEEQRDLGIGAIVVDDVVVDQPVYQRYAQLIREGDLAVNGATPEGAA